MSNQQKIYLLAFMSFLVGTSQYIIVGVLDQIATSLNISLSKAGQLVSVYALASAIGAPLIIMVTARMSQKAQLILSLIIFIIGIFAMLLFQSYLLIVISRMIIGAGAGVFIVIAYGISAQLAEKGKQGVAMANIAMGFSLALVLGIPLGRMITAVANWQTIFWMIGILSLLCLVVVHKSIPKTLSQTPIALRVQLAYLKQPKILSALGVTFLFFISYAVINTYIMPLLFSIRTISEHEISTILLALGITSFIGTKLAGFLADHVGIAPTLIGSMLLSCVMLVLLLLVSHSLILTSLLLLIWISAAWTFGPAQSIHLAFIAPETSGILLSLNISFVQFGFATGAALGGISIAHLPIHSLYGIAIFFVLMALFLLLFSRKWH
ncbi:MFS transporter [Sulfurospirillum diekertiae]|uniref:MFS transporter n=1 Tax=Sulfurospirillum diekertiae TaxID=1854492 RepID=UPI000B4DEE2A|nr:MFS transporter [Sulfurospirillum diekertiae]ASC94353.1 Purine efflux pump PbuE [Sulfurospirillum diekertiae]